MGRHEKDSRLNIIGLMEPIKKNDFLNFPFMNSEEINFILLEPSLDEIFSHPLKKGDRSEVIDLLKNDPTGTLLLPFIKTERS